MDFDKLIASMTLRQKAAQLTQFGAQLLDDPDHPDITGAAGYLDVTEDDLRLCGSVFNTSGPEARIHIQDAHLAGDPNKIPLVFMQDVIHGLRTIYPIPLAMAASFDPALVEELAHMAADEASAAGVDVAFSPMVDMSRDARWGRVMEGGGEDVHLNCVMAAAQVKGYAAGGMDSCVKHYACYGAGEAGRDYNTVDMSEARLREHYLPAYKAALDAGAGSIMPSFNSMNGVPSIANKLLMNKILRDEWQFDGLVVSDYGAVAELINHGAAADEADAAQLAIEAGCDLEMMSPCYVHALEKLLEEGRITMAQIDARVLAVLRYKEKLGLFENPHGRTDARKYAEVCLSPAHREKARRAAEQTAVLLKNDGVLPLSDKAKKIAVIGPFADDGMSMGFWALNGKTEETVTMLQGIRDRLPDAEIRTCAGCSGDLQTSDLSGIAEAAEMAAWADQVILVLGESGNHTGEGQSRAKLELSEAQMALLRAVNAKCAKTAVLLMCGRPLAIPDMDREAHAILCMWQPGTEGGHAAARLLYGDVCPCGHLPMTFPHTTGQEPISYDMYATGRMPADPFHSENQPYSSRWMDTPVMPLYPFGHGLTYTTFELKDAKLSADTLTANGKLDAVVTLCNTGSREAAAVVQLYIRDCVGSMVRPLRELKDFQKITLAPGEETVLHFPITEPMLRFQTLTEGYASEPGKFEVMMALDAWGGDKLSFTLTK